MEKGVGEGPKIEIASKRTSLSELQRRADILKERDIKEEERAREQARPVEVRVDLQPVADVVGELKGALTKIVEDSQGGRMTSEQIFALYSKQTEELSQALRHVPPEKERENWVDLEYRQEFWARFEPRSWPGFYEEAGFKERQLWDARWQLARAAFHKKITGGFPDKYMENQDLAILGKEQMEMLYGVPGVRQMLQGYTQAIIDGEKVELPSGKKMSFWEIKDTEGFEKFRIALRKKMLLKRGFSDLSAKEADSVSWNLLWVGNLAESVDSRYSFSGLSHNMPTVVMQGEYKYVFHPQERFEGKSVSGHFWGAFGKWGVTQIQRIREEAGYDSSKDEFWFRPANDIKNYWKWDRTKELPFDEIKRAKGGRVFIVDSPECYPVSVAGSFWENTTIEVLEKEKFVKKPLLDYLKDGKDIPWSDVQQDAWGIYMAAKFNKAVKLSEYWNPGKPMDDEKAGGLVGWANSLLELYTRLGLDGGEYNRLAGKDSKRPLPPKATRTYQTFKGLKLWAVYAASGGIRNPEDKKPTINLGWEDLLVTRLALRGKRIRYF